ncbi:MAG TPA: hypothetical protein VLL25_15905 [Acidimicrobiales bacterium]|nr:hypothetical protein [Acidimicrobiales bacterium]
MSFLGDKQRKIDFQRVPSITGLRGPDENDPATLLMAKALKVLDERGWTKVRFKNERGNVCLLGALRIADGRWPRWPGHGSPAYRQAVAQLNRLAHHRGHNRATFFNDDPRTGYHDVVAFVEQAMRQSGPRPLAQVGDKRKPARFPAALYLPGRGLRVGQNPDDNPVPNRINDMSEGVVSSTLKTAGSGTRP